MDNTPAFPSEEDVWINEKEYYELNEKYKKQAEERGEPQTAFARKKYKHISHKGMTLRDYFAGQCLASFGSHIVWRDDTVKDAYEMADAMLKERSKKDE